MQSTQLVHDGRALARVLGQWLPLAAAWMLMCIEGPFVAGVISRLPEVGLNLAAFGLSLALLLFFEAPILNLISASAALSTSATALRRLVVFGCSAGAVLSFALALVSVPSVFEVVIAPLFTIEPRVAELLQEGILILSPCPLAVGYRRLFQGVLIRSHRPRLVTLGTLTRLVGVTATGIELGLGSRLPGCSIACWSLTVGMVLESFVLRALAATTVSQLKRIEDAPEAPAYGWIARFYAPLALTIMVTLSINPIVSSFVSRASFPLQSLAVLPVISSLNLVFRCFGFAYQEVVVSHLSPKDALERHLTTGMWLLAAASFVSYVVMIATPIGDWWFGRVMALGPDLTRFAEFPALLFAPLPPLSVFTAYLRGVLIHRHRTLEISIAAGIELAATIIILYVTVILSGMLGAIAAALAFNGGQILSTMYLWLRYRIPTAIVSTAHPIDA